MEPIQDGADRRTWHCTCGFGLEAVRVAARGRGGQAMTALFAREAAGAVTPGRRIGRCPRCAKALPWIPWERFLAECARGFTP
jgi:hypothetical protein